MVWQGGAAAGTQPVPCVHSFWACCGEAWGPGAQQRAGARSLTPSAPAVRCWLRPSPPLLPVDVTQLEVMPDLTRVAIEAGYYHAAAANVTANVGWAWLGWAGLDESAGWAPSG